MSDMTSDNDSPGCNTRLPAPEAQNSVQTLVPAGMLSGAPNPVLESGHPPPVSRERRT